ncbi:MAG: prohibitin family protein [Clostridia bacterium]|nr:prohibitin family protein [Clostridia bacterium]
MNNAPYQNARPVRTPNGKFVKGVALAVVIVVLALVVYGFCTAVVPTGYTGILTTFGKVADYTLDAGFHLKSPFQKVTLMDNREQKSSFTTEAFSSDIQQVNIMGSINYNINKTTAMNLFKDVGVNYFNTLVSPRMLENMKAVFSKYTAEELISSRDQLSVETRGVLSKEMERYGINIINISIEDIDFADAFTNAVEAKQVAQQAKLKAQIEQEQATMEAQQAASRKKIAAEAEANVQKINADAAAYAIRAEAEAKAEANQKIADSLTDELIKYTEVSQWNGQLPTYMAGEGSQTVPVLDLSK